VISVVDAPVALVAPDTAEVGASIVVTWAGPDEPNDFISVASADQKGNQYVNYTYSREGSPLKLKMPPEPGSYEIRYILNQDRRIMASRTIDVAAVTAAVQGPQNAIAGETVTVGWTGPDYDNDFISVAGLEQKGNQYVNYTYTRDGNPLKLVMPPEPGSYEIRYVLNQDRQVLASMTVEVGAVVAKVTAPAEAAAGSTAVITWEGPDYANDFITVTLPDQKGGQYIAYAYTRDGNPLKVVMPPEPGSYEIRYVMNQGKTVLDASSIEIKDVSASLDAPGSASAGGMLKVDWVGPDYPGDFVSVAEAGSKDADYKTFAYTRDGTPALVKLPDAPGDYEIRYVMKTGKRVIERAPLRID
jgi:Ca-activated chloride channel family protein